MRGMIATIALSSRISLICRFKSGHLMLIADDKAISITGMISGYTVRLSEYNCYYNLESFAIGENPIPDPPGLES